MIGLLALWLQPLLITLKYRKYSATADLHTFHFTVAHALGFSVFTSLQAADLNTETSTVSLSHKLQILHIIKIFKSHAPFSSLYSQLLNPPGLSKVKVKVTLRLTVSQSVLVLSPIWGSGPDIYYCLTVTVFFLWGALSDERTGPSFVRGEVKNYPHFCHNTPLGLSHCLLHMHA
jgi:hypothetical protein